MKGRQLSYTPAELAWIKSNCTRPRADAHAEFVTRFRRDDVSLDNYKALCTRKGWRTGRTGCFPKGNVSHNKGKRGFCAPGSEKGWFKPGERGGVAIKLYKPIGTERVSRDGYIERKVNDDLPLQARWKTVHRINWETANGPLPDGHRLKCLDGNKANTAASNWVAVPYALGPRLSGLKRGTPYDTAPPELRPVIMAAAKLEHAIREIRTAQTQGKAP